MYDLGSAFRQRYNIEGHLRRARDFAISVSAILAAVDTPAVDQWFVHDNTHDMNAAQLFAHINAGLNLINHYFEWAQP